MSSRTVTIAEAHELTGLSIKALRNRVDRGQLRALKRDGVRRIPLSELHRAGLLEQDGSEAGEAIEGQEEARELVNRELLTELAKAHERIGTLQALTVASESTKAELEHELERRRTAERELELVQEEYERLRSRSLLERIRNR